MCVFEHVGYASEIFVFTVATLVLIYEYDKSETSGAKKSRLIKERETNFKMYVNARFTEIDSKIADLDAEIQSIKKPSHEKEDKLQKVESKWYYLRKLLSTEKEK